MGRELKGVIAAFAISLFVAVAVSQESSPADKPASNEKKESVSGKDLYAAHCETCHGANGKGGGPFAAQLKVAPPDLTQIAKKNKGVFPTMHISEVIDGEFEKPAHGSREMPIWGPVFRSLAHGRADSALVRLNNLVQYLESLQQK